MKTNLIIILANLLFFFISSNISSVAAQKLFNGEHEIIILDTDTPDWLEIFADPLHFDCSCDEVISVIVKPTEQENVYVSDDQKLSLTIIDEQYIITAKTDQCCYVKSGTYLSETTEEIIDLPPAYHDLASMICSCVNSSSSELSDDFKQIVVNADGDMYAFQVAMTDYATEHPEKAEAESNKLIACSNQIEKCIDDLKDSFETLSIEEDEETITNNITLAMDAKEGCAFAHGLLVIGLQAK